MLVGVSAVFIGACALGISLYETSLMRWEQRASVLPLLELGRSYNLGEGEKNVDAWRLSLHAENVGIGPARIMNFIVEVDGVPTQSWGDAIRALIGHEETVAYGQSTINGRTIPPDREVTMFELKDTKLTREIINNFDRLTFSACFCSIFDECWITSNTTFGTSRSVEACAKPEKSFLE